MPKYMISTVQASTGESRDTRQCATNDPYGILDDIDYIQRSAVDAGSTNGLGRHAHDTDCHNVIACLLWRFVKNGGLILLIIL